MATILLYYTNKDNFRVLYVAATVYFSFLGMSTVEIVALAWLLLLGGSAVVWGSENPRPDYYRTVCEISDTCALLDYCEYSPYCYENSGDYYYLSRGRTGLRDAECGNAVDSCVVSEGMRLEVRCQRLEGEEDNGDDRLTLYVNGTRTVNEDGGSSGSRIWTFVTAQSAEGVYECRWPNGSSFGNRSVIVDGKNFTVSLAMPITNFLNCISSCHK